MENTINVFEIIKIAVPSVITIIGFIVTYNLNLANITKEIYKSKNLKSSEELSKIIQPLLDFTRGDINDNENIKEKFNSIFDIIIIYGSSKLIRIATTFKEYTFKGNNNINDLFAYVGVLISQLKYDISGEYIPADTWYRYTIKDYDKIRKSLVKKIDDLIKTLKLDDKLKCK